MGDGDQAAWFAGRLRELREKAGLTQEQLGEKAGLTRGGVAQLEIGRRAPSWDTVLAICSALGVSCEAFRQPPAAAPRKGPGRPPKAKPAEAAGGGAGKKRGRKGGAV